MPERLTIGTRKAFENNYPFPYEKIQIGSETIYTRLRSRSSPSLSRWLIVSIDQGRTIKLLVRMYDDLSFLKAMIECREGIPAGQQRIFFDGKVLEPGKFMLENEIPDKSLLSMVTTTQGDDEAFR